MKEYTWEECVEILIEKSRGSGKYGHDHYRKLTHESHPQYLMWREHVQSKVTGIKKEIIVSETKVNNRVVISTGGGGITTIPTAESIQLTKEMNACHYYERNSGCGCGRARCKIGKGEPDMVKNDGSGLISTWDCFHCLRPDVELYAIHAYKKPV